MFMRYNDYTDTMFVTFYYNNNYCTMFCAWAQTIKQYNYNAVNYFCTKGFLLLYLLILRYDPVQSDTAQFQLQCRSPPVHEERLCRR